MLLAVDIGNTNINFAIFKGDKITRRFFIPVSAYNRTALKRKLGAVVFDAAIVSSVVPAVTAALEKGLAALAVKKVYVLGKNAAVPIKNRYRYPRQVGTDRLVNAYSAINFFGAPAIVIDFGTAITFDVVSKGRQYCGGMILPGLKISAAALAERTALLPKVALKRPKEFIGRDTESSILNGLIYGFASLSDELARRLKKKIGKNAKVIGTGGDIGLVARYCRELDAVDRDLPLKGLNLIYKTL
ncbi:MAG: type III pantothenate kinase [Deltaproteobacteria bacterium]